MAWHAQSMQRPWNRTHHEICIDERRAYRQHCKPPRPHYCDGMQMQHVRTSRSHQRTERAKDHAMTYVDLANASRIRVAGAHPCCADDWNMAGTWFALHIEFMKLTAGQYLFKKSSFKQLCSWHALANLSCKLDSVIMARTLEGLTTNWESVTTNLESKTTNWEREHSFGKCFHELAKYDH